MMDLYEYQKGSIWIKEYPIHYAGTEFNARMTVVRLLNGQVFIHSPCEIDSATQSQIEQIGEVAFIVAPGSFHFSYVESAQKAFPDAETFICPGVERKKPDIQFDWLLGDRPDQRWENDFDQVFVRGNRIICETAFYHKPTRTLILVDLLENITDQTADVSWTLKFWWKCVFHMWNHPKPAPEYQIGWKDKKAAAGSLRRILEWDFERVIIAHGDLIEENAKDVVSRAWKNPLGA